MVTGKDKKSLWIKGKSNVKETYVSSENWPVIPAGRSSYKNQPIAYREKHNIIKRLLHPKVVI